MASFGAALIGFGAGFLARVVLLRPPSLARTLIRSGTRLAVINAGVMNGNANVAREVRPPSPRDPVAQYH